MLRRNMFRVPMLLCCNVFRVRGGSGLATNSAHTFDRTSVRSGPTLPLCVGASSFVDPVLDGDAYRKDEHDEGEPYRYLCHGSNHVSARAGAGGWAGLLLRLRLQCSQAPRRLVRVMVRSGRCERGMMWSAVVLMWVQPGSCMRHVGSCCTTWSRSLRHALL